MAFLDPHRVAPDRVPPDRVPPDRSLQTGSLQTGSLQSIWLIVGTGPFMMRNMNSMIEPLWQGTLAGTLPPTWPDLTVDAGQALQLEMLDRWLANGERLAGYKIGLTSGKMRDAFGPGVRPFGYILASRVHQSGDRVRLADIGRMGVENELVFRVGQDIFTPTATARDASMVVDRVDTHRWQCLERSAGRRQSVPVGHRHRAFYSAPPELRRSGGSPRTRR
jgi:hypothetical protein